MRTGVTWQTLKEAYFSAGKGPLPDCHCAEWKVAKWGQTGAFERLCAVHEIQHGQNAGIIATWGGTLPPQDVLAPLDYEIKLSWYDACEVYNHVWDPETIVRSTLAEALSILNTLYVVGPTERFETFQHMLIHTYDLPAHSVELNAEAEENRDEVRAQLRK